MRGVCRTTEQRLWCLLIVIYASAVPGLAVITRLTPVCLPGLIDLNADVEAVVLGVTPAIIGAYWLPATARAITPLLWIWMTGALLGLPGGPGPLPDAIQTLYPIALGIVILRSVGKASSPQGWALAVPLAAALMVLAIPRKASLRWASEPSILVIGGATALRLIAPYDPAILIGTAAMWFVGGLLIAHRCRQPV